MRSRASISKQEIDKELKRNFVIVHEPVTEITASVFGNHWVTNLLTLLINKDIRIESHISVHVNLIDLLNTERMANKPSPRIITSHLPFHRLPEEHIQRNGPIILIVRNPKDVAVSAYHHATKDNVVKSTLCFDAFLDAFLVGNVIYGSYFDYLNKWQRVIDENKHLSVHIAYYEDLIQDCVAELKKMQDYLGIHNSDVRLHEIVDRCSINRLRDDVDSGRLRTMMVDENKKPYLYRKGEVGDWQNYFTEAQNEAFDEVIKDKLRGSMFNFKYRSSTPKHRL